jgi:hypothetical protein
MMHWVLASFTAATFAATAQAPGLIGEIPTEEDCLAFIAILPTFHSEKMKLFYENNPQASGKQLVEKIESLADGGDKDLQFTYSQLLLTGYCVPKDLCSARRYLIRSRGSLINWEQMYPSAPWPKDVDALCK